MDIPENNLPVDPTDETIRRLLEPLDRAIDELYPPEVIELKLDLLKWEVYGPDWL